VEYRASTLRRGDARIAYEAHEGVGREAVVLLHGFGMSRAALRPLAASLRDAGVAGRTLIADARGHGDTRCPPDDAAFRYPAMRDDLDALIEREAPAGAHLVGHSMGGQIALMLALSRPERVKSLCLLGAGPCRAVTDERERRTWLRAAAAFEAATREELCASLATAAPTRHPDLSPERLYGAARGDDLARVIRGGFLHVEDNDGLCPEVRAPALVIAGADDRGWLEPSRRLAQLLPRSELRVVEGAGHLVHLERERDCGRWIADFLRAAPTPGA